MLNLSAVLESSARDFPDRDAVVLGDLRLSYSAIDAAANQVANLLVRNGIKPGDKVALSCPNLPYFPIIYFGILKAGAVVVPLNVLLKHDEIAYHIGDAEVRMYFCFEGSSELPMGKEGWAAFEMVETCEQFFLVTADPAAASPIEGAQTFSSAVSDLPALFDAHISDSGDTAVILYTSGTTGRAKGAELSHANIMMNAFALTRLFGEHPQGHDRILIVLPLFHTFGQTVQMILGFLQSATLIFMPRFEARGALALMQSEQVTCFAGVPTMYWGLLNALDDTIDVVGIASRLRMSVSGGAALPQEIQKEFMRRFNIRILEGYGLSETSPVATFSRKDMPLKVGSIGVPIWGVQVKLINDDWSEVSKVGDIGEIAVRGHNIMKGYFRRDAETRTAIRDGWFRTGDLARRDEDGAYFIVDRSKDMINRGGFNVYPREIEELLVTHPAVSLAAVVGIGDSEYGEEIKAFVILKPGADVSESELIQWARERIAAYKYPRSVEFRESLPMTASGKILKRELVAGERASRE
ncbi:long-chain fatty acid--CoA ligase [Dokdonella sp.]|uniref:long-chain-fatty-acid--CoA ligase n=1 Tax=Dokdonella sp. TaxID=2291710 RepID=UPI003528B578